MIFHLEMSDGLLILSNIFFRISERMICEESAIYVFCKSFITKWINKFSRSLRLIEVDGSKIGNLGRSFFSETSVKKNIFFHFFVNAHLISDFYCINAQCISDIQWWKSRCTIGWSIFKLAWLRHPALLYFSCFRLPYQLLPNHAMMKIDDIR